MNYESLRALYIKYAGAYGTLATGEDIERELAKESSERRRIIADVVSGVSFADVGRRMKGITGGSIQSRVTLTMKSIRARLELDPRNGGYTLGAKENRLPDHLRAEAKRLADQGVARSEICTRLGVSKASLSRWLRITRFT
jgi:hypothetical protein